MIALSGLTVEARPIVRQVAQVYLKHTAPWFIGLLAHGSAVKGGIIPNCSDIDLQLYLDRSAFTWQGQLPLELGFAVRRDLEGIQLFPFRYVQCFAQTDEPQENWVGPIPGAYHLVAGRLPVKEATADDLCASARRALTKLNPAPTFFQGELLGPGGMRLERSIRLLCTKVWPVLYQVLTLLEQGTDPIGIWCLPKEQAIEQLPRNTALQETIRAFYQAVWEYYPTEDSLENALAVIESGIAFLGAASSWWTCADSRTWQQQGETVICVLGFVGDLKLVVPDTVPVTSTSAAFLTDSRIFDAERETLLEPFETATQGYADAKSKLRFESWRFVTGVKVRRPGSQDADSRREDPSCPSSAWSVEDTPQDLGLIYHQMGVKGLEGIEKVGARLAAVAETLLDELLARPVV